MEWVILRVIYFQDHAQMSNYAVPFADSISKNRSGLQNLASFFSKTRVSGEFREMGDLDLLFKVIEVKLHISTLVRILHFIFSYNMYI